MTLPERGGGRRVVEAYRLDRYDNVCFLVTIADLPVVEAYRLDRYDNSMVEAVCSATGL